jgi:DNA-binding beta-propeller fold protein YncE
MKRGLLIGVVFFLLPWAWILRYLPSRALAQTASAQAPHIGEGGLPQFQVDPIFPKLPSKWRMGFGSAVAIDDKDHVWILSRPRGLAHPRSTAPDLTSTPAPPVIEFDNDGNFIQGWGGESGPGYQWPANEHSITVDYKGFVWIVGNADGAKDNPANLPNDNQILKFTKEGKFVMAIGKSGQTGSNATEVLRGASGLRVYPKTNELFVTDGYGNSRVMVYDADTGKLKRMWGAYGNKPLDAEARPPHVATMPNALCPSMCGLWEALQQFSVPHDVNISDDGLVYISDRGNKRIQVFTTEGKFIAEQFLGLESKYPLQARSTAFSPDQRFLYVAGTPVTYILNRKTLEVLGTFDVGSSQAHPPGHQIASDHKGNVYEVQAELTGADGKSGGTGAYKFIFKGYSPATSCPPSCQSTGSSSNN